MDKENLEEVIDKLKDFQRATVNYVEERFESGQRRMLVADEAGLGKTLIARGVLAKRLEHCYEAGRPFNVFYICSNSAIAAQNLKKLDLFPKKGKVKEDPLKKISSSRLSMLHLNIYLNKKDSSGLRLISLSPGTSLRSTKFSSCRERALMLRVLGHKYSSVDIEKAMSKAVKGWDNIYNEDFSEEKLGDYLDMMADKLPGESEIIEEFKNDTSDKKAEFILWLKNKFSEISLDMLEPDLIILDEFQRFSDLLKSAESSDGPDPDMIKLIKKFFRTDEENGPYILMLSATPFNMYPEPKDDDDKLDLRADNSGFDAMMKFLKGKDYDGFKNIWDEYVNDPLDDKKREAARKALYGSVCRTERISETKMANHYSEPQVPMDFSEDIKAYGQLADYYKKLAELNGKADPNGRVSIRQALSSPYILSFMNNDYKIKKTVRGYLDNLSEEDKKLLPDSSLLWLPEANINSFEPIPPVNARLKAVMDTVFPPDGFDISKLMWLPPSMPYYKPEGAYEGTESLALTKTLVFSAFRMVPRMLACLLSYECERRTVGMLCREKDLQDYKRFRKNKKIDMSDSEKLIPLIYPSKALADVYDPKEYLGKGYSYSKLRDIIAEKLTLDLKKLKSLENGTETDNSWYYLAPKLLDGLSAGNKTLGKQPEDLAKRLAAVALGSPAVCMYRTCRWLYKDSSNSIPQSKKSAKEFAKAFIKKQANSYLYFAVSECSEDDPVFSLISYCGQGCLQAMLDEYAYLISESHPNDDPAEIIKNAVSLAPASLTVDMGVRSQKMYSHFAAAFTENDESNEKKAKRKEKLQLAFNSPFRPFVLASTSIGQEGIDLHNYCRRIVHWNLPCNPVDLEQRDGRIDRYKSLVIRQNIARIYGSELTGSGSDIWEELFSLAEKAKPEGASDLIPFWGLAKENAVKKEKLFLVYPFSSEKASYERLKDSLRKYRMMLGRPKENEETLKEIFGDKEFSMNLSPFFISNSSQKMISEKAADPTP